MKQYLSAEEIAEVLRAEGDGSISGRTVHYYAEQRLLPSPEYDGARPRYSEVHLAAMRHVRELKRQGHTLERIGVLVGTHGQVTSQPNAAQREHMSTGAGISGSSAPQPTDTVSASNTRTLVVGPGLTLSASGWDDAALNQIVQAVTEALKTIERADAREREDHDTEA